jgi:hypothetical protein
MSFICVNTHYPRCKASTRVEAQDASRDAGTALEWP